MASAPDTDIADVPAAGSVQVKVEEQTKHTLTPPASDQSLKNGDDSSELSELDMEEDDIGEITPDHYWDDGHIPVFKPTMHQFKSFKKFIDKIDKYGMKSGIVKVIPPKEWRDSLPALDEQVKTIKVKNPITQEFNGTQGKFTQANMEKQRTYNLPQWKAVTEESSHQPPAKRGERRRNQDKPTRPSAPKPQRKSTPLPIPDGQKRKPGRPRTRPLPNVKKEDTPIKSEPPIDSVEVPPTPESPSLKPTTDIKESQGKKADTPVKTKGRQPKSVSSRRKNNSHEQAEEIDEEAFREFDYRMDNLEEWTKERCQELESAYWKSLNFNNPMYGADMPGSLFDESTTSWNVAKLENLLDVLGQKVPGVNTAYLYLGMWKATFAWHLEDVDLYSINYIHFGAPKQWYSISQEDARRFEAAMRNLWPQDAKNCDQFLRHKTYLISPQVLKSQFNIEVNKLVHYEGEFVITYPYGYHSGYNLGYNCAESVNFATESWLDFGKIAKKCNCEADSVWVDVYDIERKLRGEPTPEYEEYVEYTDEEDKVVDLPTPPGSEKDVGKSRKRKADTKDGASKTVVKRLRLNAPKPPKAPCALCPNDWPYEDLLPTAEGKQIHRICALYIPETFVDDTTGTEVIHGFQNIDQQRLNLNCLFCRRKNNGACFQCNHPKCPRSYHATCAASAGVAVEIGLQARYDEQGTEYSDVGIDLRCRFHRPKRYKYSDALACSEGLEESEVVFKHARNLVQGDSVQFMFYKGDILAGYVIENRQDESMILLDLVPHRRTIEVEYKWVLPFDKAHSQLTAPSENAKPLPAHLARRSQTTQDDPTNDNPKPDDSFGDAQYERKWAEFKVQSIVKNPDQKPVDLSKPQSLAYYLGRTSTEAKPQYTEDPAQQRNNISLNFLETVRSLLAPASQSTTASTANSGTQNQHPQNQHQHQQLQQHLQQQHSRNSLPAAYPAPVRVHAPSKQQPNLKLQQLPRQSSVPGPLKHERTSESSRLYKGKYAIGTEHSLKGGRVDPQALRNQQAFLLSSQQHAHAHNSPTNFARYPHPQQPQQQQQHQQGSQQRAGQPVMRPGTNMQNMADIRRRQSNPPPPLNMEQVQRMQWQQSSRPGSQHQHGSRPSSSQQHAPVANMMGSNSPAAQSTFSRSTTSQQTPPSTAHSSIGSRSRSDSVKALAKYPYLHAAAMSRPQVYQSPYGPPGIITDPYLPISKPTAILRPRGKSLTQNFLDCATPSQREGLKGHVRTISIEKATLRAQESDRRKQESLQRLRANMPPPTHPLSPTFGQSFTHDLFPDRTFADSPGFSEFNSHPYQTNSDFGNYFHTFQPQPHIHYSSPQAFQQQVRQEEQNLRHKPHMMSHGRNSYGAMKNLNTGLANMHPHTHGGQDVIVGPNGSDHHHSNNAGSPIRTGRDGVGTATLPMMDPSSF